MSVLRADLAPRFDRLYTAPTLQMHRVDRLFSLSAGQLAAFEALRAPHLDLVRRMADLSISVALLALSYALACRALLRPAVIRRAPAWRPTRAPLGVPAPSSRRRKSTRTLLASG